MLNPNCLNIQFILLLLKYLYYALYTEQLRLKEETVHVYGVRDDYIYCEILQRHFVGLLPAERKALMGITRCLINESAEAYEELLKEGFTDFEETVSIDEFIESLEADEEF